MIAADRCVTRPLPADEGNEAAAVVVVVRLALDLVPDRCGDLKVVALMSSEIDERGVAGEGEL